MGGTVKDIPTVTGKKVRLKIPAKTPPGKVFRLKGQGVHNQRHQRTGDHLVTVEVKIPRKLTREQREFVEGFTKK
jgi:molecular chaperone DnaJ